MRALWASVLWPAQQDTGGRIRAAQTLGHLADLADRTTVVGLSDADRTVPPLELGPNVDVIDPISWHISIRDRPVDLMKTAVGAARHRLSYRTGKFDSVALADRIEAELPAADLLYVSYLGTYAAVARLRRRGVTLPPIVYDAQNVEHVATVESRDGLSAGGVGARAMSAAVRIEARRVRRDEADMVSMADVVVAINDHDVEPLRQLGARQVVVVPPIATPLARTEPGRAVLVLGNWSWPPTGGSLGAIAPGLAAVPADRPRQVVGTGASPALIRAVEAAGFDHLGRVAEIEPYWADAAVVVIPGRGTGSRMRFLDAFRHGVPVVATHDSAAGIEVGEGAVLVDRDLDVGPAVAELLADPDRLASVTAGAWAVARSHHSRERATAAMAEALNHVRGVKVQVPGL